MSQKPGFDASIPVLTEVFQEVPAAAGASATDAEWALLEQRLCERILDQLQGQVDAALQSALAGLSDEIRRSLRRTIGPTVAGAVAQELAHLQSLKP